MALQVPIAQLPPHAAVAYTFATLNHVPGEQLAQELVAVAVHGTEKYCPAVQGVQGVQAPAPAAENIVAAPPAALQAVQPASVPGCAPSLAVAKVPAAQTPHRPSSQTLLQPLAPARDQWPAAQGRQVVEPVPFTAL